MKTLGAILIAVLLLGGVVVVVLWDQFPWSEEEEVFCTLDAKLCPDGSYVGRVAPDCEFAACPEQQTRRISLYYYDARQDEDGEGNIQCSRQGLAPVTREIPVTQTPIQDAVRLLIRGELTADEIAQGISTEYPLLGFELVGAVLRDGVLTLEFTDDGNRTGGGACRVGILWYQIEATALQFPEVQEVRFIPEELFQP